MSNTDVIALAKSVVDRRSSRTDDEVDQIVNLLIEKVVEHDTAVANIVEWLKARAEAAARQSPDPEQPNAQDFFTGSRSGAYNALYLAAYNVANGQAAKPRDQWPAYLRGEHVRPDQNKQETANASPAASS